MNDDLIKRTDVITAIGKAEVRASIYYKPNWDMLKKFIADIPSSDRPQGEWIQKPHKVYLPRDCEPLFEETYNEADHSTIEYWWHCNQCDYEADRMSKPTFKFCPNCGCQMKGDQIND